LHENFLLKIKKAVYEMSAMSNLAPDSGLKNKSVLLGIETIDAG